jgi:hypothetical protein
MFNFKEIKFRTQKQIRYKLKGKKARKYNLNQNLKIKGIFSH